MSDPINRGDFDWSNNKGWFLIDPLKRGDSDWSNKKGWFLIDPLKRGDSDWSNKKGWKYDLLKRGKPCFGTLTQ